MFPRFGAIPGDFPYTILGLGDIAIPGLLACLALRCVPWFVGSVSPPGCVSWNAPLQV